MKKGGKGQPEKTNVCRLLEQKKIPYQEHTYEHGNGPVDGAAVARLTGEPPEKVFKTLVTVGNSGAHYVFVIPALEELDLKKAARAAHEKSIEMIHVSELLPLTGYVRGGCSPIGMKKLFPTFFHESAQNQQTILVSGGKIGYHVELSPSDLAHLTGGLFTDLVRDKSVSE